MSEPQQGVPGAPVSPVDGRGPVPPSAYPGLVPPGYVPPGHVPPQPVPWSILAIVGFIVAFFFSVAGLVLSIFGLRETAATGKRGRGLAIAGIIVGGVRSAFDLVIVIALLVALPSFIVHIVESARSGVGASAASAGFGTGDDLPRGGEPVGMHQGLSEAGWTSSDDEPWTDAYVPLGHFTGLKDDQYPPTYDDSVDSCTAYVDMYSNEVASATLYDDSVGLLKFWINSDDTSTLTGSVTIGAAPAFHQEDDGTATPAGKYDVVQSTFEDSNGDVRGVAWARVFRTTDEEIGVVTAVVCDDTASVVGIGVPALGQDVGAAW